MNALNRSTCRRLQKLKQIPSVWEGDRRRLITNTDSGDWMEMDSEIPPEGDCILWVDGTQGMVRAMDIVTVQTGPEAVVRTLLKAMEQPHNPSTPARPKKIVVRDRELQFFLRGVLQDLDITLEYVPELPLIDEIFRGLQDAIGNRPPNLPPKFAELLTKKAYEIWEDAPWQIFADHEIIAIELNQWDVGTLYASVMGMLGMEFGVLFYRSIDSLKQFRQRAISQESLEQMQEAFLGQDCLFLTFESDDEDEPGDRAIGLKFPPSSDQLEPVFGNLHPLEGLRSFLYEDEAASMLISLEALHRFLRQHRQKLQKDSFPALSSRYRIPLPGIDGEEPSQLSVKVSTMPDLATELLAMEGADDETEAFLPSVRNDLVPENSFLSLGMVPWDVLEMLRLGAEYYQPQSVTQAGDGLPVIMIQTSRPKAKALIQDLKDAGGLQAICFNPGEDPFGGDRYDIGLLQTGNGDLHLFGEFGEDDPTHVAARKKWEQRCKKTKGYCGLIIAKGLTGASRGNPQFKDMMAIFEARALSDKDLGLGTLRLSLAVDWM
ncbi:hypothetical protein OsccyDRAFT_2055 [Leptolyngbyaceae cyanobacterium JSC-12]|nr:hypothetical protein OsccyDRAFT_2055 [Leptolyngbyaceae cyanobacterium JSC-12]